MNNDIVFKSKRVCSLDFNPKSYLCNKLLHKYAFLTLQLLQFSIGEEVGVEKTVYRFQVVHLPLLSLGDDHVVIIIVKVLFTFNEALYAVVKPGGLSSYYVS